VSIQQKKKREKVLDSARPLEVNPQSDEKQPSEQQPHARLRPEKFDELAGGGDR
jgi:hypothetical protein